ncbi:MAG: asparagine synthase (glutamine-hydrolyzing) [Gaiellaceae bacterium]
MCGIVGLAGAAPLASSDLDVVELLRHRGPDSEGRFASDGVGVAMRRLAIIDLETGDQPIASESGEVTCVLNGELYNHVELRAELEARGHRFSTRSDVEVVVHLYEEEGERCFARLRGMFAAAVWDERRHRLVLARDRFGIKPLYLAETGGRLMFASEIAPLLALGAPRRPDLQALADYLSFGYVPGEATGLEGVRALRAGHTLVWEDGGATESEFAGIESRPAADLEATLAEAVRIHLRSDVPLAVLLSGGIDSSLVAALAAAEAGQPLHTFTIGFEDEAYDEREHGRVVAAALGTEHHELEVETDVVHDLPAIVRHLGEPFAAPSAIPLYYVCRAAAEHVKVALAGEGGDEVFGGYSRFAWDRHAARLQRVLPTRVLAGALEPLLGARAARGGRKSLPRRALKLLRHASLPEAERYFSWFALLSEEAKAELLPVPAPASRIFAELFGEAPAGLTRLGRLQYVDLRTMVPKEILFKADRMSMAHSLELRVPLLDHEVVAAGLGLPDAEKVRGVETKRALRRLVERRLPRSIARRPKQGFEVPIDRWLRGELRETACELLAEERLRRHGLVDPKAAGRLLRRHLDGEAELGLPVYALVVLELWLEQVVERTPVAAAA